MRFVTPWSLSRKEPRRRGEAASFPWRDSGRSPRSKRTAHRRAYPWDRLSGLVGNALGRKREKGDESDRSSHSVAVDDRPERVTVRLDMPRVKKTDLSVGHEDGSLVVSARTASSNGRSHRRSQVTHEIPLGEGLEWDNAHARLKSGTLMVEIPRAQSRGSGPETIRVG